MHFVRGFHHGFEIDPDDFEEGAEREDEGDEADYGGGEGHGGVGCCGEVDAHDCGDAMRIGSIAAFRADGEAFGLEGKEGQCLSGRVPVASCCTIPCLRISVIV